MKTRNILLLLFVVCLAATMYFLKVNNKHAEAKKSVSRNLEQVDIGYSRLRISLPVFVAKEAGFFEKYGIDANLEMYETAQPLMQALVEGRIEVAGYTALPITYNGMLRSEKDLYFLSVMLEDQNHRISYFLRARTPVGQSPQISSIGDLKGKVIGILPTIAYKAWLEAILKENDLVPGRDVIIQQVAPTLQAQALKSGGVDALFTNDPSATSAIKTGVAEPFSNQVEVPVYLGSPFPFGSFNISKKWADQNPQTAKKVAQALNEAIIYVNSNPEKAKEHMVPYLPDLFKPHVGDYPDASYIILDAENQGILQAAAEQYLEIGIIKSPVDLTGLVYNSNDK